MPPRPRWAVSWWEPFTALGIGAVLNLALTVAANATGIAAIIVDPQWAAWSGAAGGLVSALVHLGVVCLGAEPPTRQEILRGAIESVFAVIVGGLCAGFAVPSIIRFLHSAAPADVRAIGFGVGMLAWRVAPGVFGAAKLLSSPSTLRDIALRWLGARAPS